MPKRTKEIYIEGNNGGDYLKIISLGNNLLHLEQEINQERQWVRTPEDQPMEHMK